MKRVVLYTLISVLNLIVFAIAAAFLPAQVAVHFTGGAAERFVSPWVLLAFPAAAAMISLAGFAAELRMKSARRTYLLLALFALGGVLSLLGWRALALAAQGASYGETVYGLPWFTVAIALATLGLLAGYFFAAKEGLPEALSGRAVNVFAASLAGYVVSVSLAFGVPVCDWASAAIVLIMLAAAVVVPPVRLKK